MTPTSLSDAKEIRTADIAPRPMLQFAMALGLYLLWTAIAWLGVATGELAISQPAGYVLLGGVAATNALFFGIARSGVRAELTAAGVAAAQCLFGIGWATVFLLLATGGSQLSLGMFVCANLFALFQVRKRSFMVLAAIAGVCYATAIMTRHGLTNGALDFRPELLNLVTYIGLAGWLTLFATYLDDLRQQLHDRNAELRDHIRKVVRIAERDHLTKSFNRHYIMDTLAREKGRADRNNTPVSVCIFDLDHFKALNDEHGHLVGDRVLKRFAKRVRNELRAMDMANPSDHRRSFGRFGGEEFIAILPSTALAGAATCAERIRATIADKPIDDIYKVTVSVGVAEYQRGETVPEMLARADDALYRAKAEGRNRIVIDGDVAEHRAEVHQLRPSGG